MVRRIERDLETSFVRKTPILGWSGPFCRPRVSITAQVFQGSLACRRLKMVIEMHYWTLQ